MEVSALKNPFNLNYKTFSWWRFANGANQELHCRVKTLNKPSTSVQGQDQWFTVEKPRVLCFANFTDSGPDKRTPNKFGPLSLGLHFWSVRRNSDYSSLGRIEFWRQAAWAHAFSSQIRLFVWALGSSLWFNASMVEGSRKFQGRVKLHKVSSRFFLQPKKIG